MKKFLIKVNGKDYEVDVEEVGGSEAVMTATKTVTVPKAAETKKAAPATQDKQGAVKISAPMPGTILSIKKKAGDQVKKGETILILEAMKMENEIPAPQDGTVSSINVESGASVESGQLLASLS